MESAALPLVVLGEIRTCLVPDATALSRGSVEDLLTLVPGRRVLSRERPIAFATSPTIPVGVDCRLATPARTRVRAIGTVATNAVVLGGRVLQSSAHTTVVRAQRPRRETWSHYLSRVGSTEVITRIQDRTSADLVDGYVATCDPQTDSLDLASISQRMLARIRMDLRLDQNAPIQAATTRLRWAARIADAARPAVAFRLQDETVRTALLTVRDAAELAGVRRFCEDLAVHDWLLTVTAAVVEEADLFPPASAESAQVLAPLLEHLVHLWMPGAHTRADLRGLWDQLEDDPGFTRQWTARVGQLRDRMSVATLAALRRTKISSQDW